VNEDEMSPEAWRLLEVVREAESPSELDRRRVRRAIAVGAGATVAPAVAKAASVAAPKTAAAVTAGKGAALVAAAKGAAAIAVLASMGTGAVWWSRHRSPEPAAALPAVRSLALDPGEAAPPSTLLGELTLLQRAQRALANGAPREALALTDQHAARYPGSQLARERDAVRVFAYCALGRTPEARALATEILKKAPRSPLRASLGQSCAAPLPE
jgi:hypothetical protein